MENCARPKRPHSPLPGVGGVNTTREQIAHIVGSSHVFRSKKKQSKWAAFSLSMRAKKRFLQQHRKFSSEPVRGDSGEEEIGGGLEPEGGELWGDVGEGGGHRV